MADNSMLNYPFFDNMLNKLQTKANAVEKNGTLKYSLGGLKWHNDINKMIKTAIFPSNFFVQTVVTRYFIGDYLTNPPEEGTDPHKCSYIRLAYNKMLIIDALFNHGSTPRYQPEPDNNNIGLYSEHTGALDIRDGNVRDLIISGETNRISRSDPSIFLPNNTSNMKKYPFIFHTHPNSSTYAGRVKNGIIYEFPSAGDINNFIKFNREGKLQASFIVAPEGIYVIRKKNIRKNINVTNNFSDRINRYTSKIEREALARFKKKDVNLQNPDIFHKLVSSDTRYISDFNAMLDGTNIFVEYYPRVKKNGAWSLPEIYLLYTQF
jgi:hypothetical protein